MSEDSVTRRNPLAAVVLSLFAPGLGHIYSGEVARGFTLFLVPLLFGPVVAGLTLLRPSTTVLIALLFTVFVVLGVYLYAVGDAFRVARRSRQNYPLRDYNRPIVYAVFILVWLTYPPTVLYALRENCFAAYFIPTRSEIPTLFPGDHVLVNRVTLQLRYPKRGDVVAFRHNLGDMQQTWVKRVIGLPGDTVEIRNGEVILNGKKLERDRVPAASLADRADGIDGEVFEEINGEARYQIMIAPVTEPIPDCKKQEVPEGRVFVLGDNRNDSRDSRYFGCIPRADVVGQLQYIYYPAQTWRRFGACAN
jgi:signal peptidase I